MTSLRHFRCLGLPYRYRRCHHPEASSENDYRLASTIQYADNGLTSRYNQLRQTECSALQNGTRDSNESAYEDCVSSSESITKVHRTEASKGSAKIERGDSRSFDQGIVGLDRSMSGRYIDLGKLRVN